MLIANGEVPCLSVWHTVAIIEKSFSTKRSYGIGNVNALLSLLDKQLKQPMFDIFLCPNINSKNLVVDD